MGAARAALAAAILGISTGVYAQVGDAPFGGPRRWEAGAPVGEYGELNLRTGRVLTTLPVVSWGGKGPGISFALYHNMTSKWSAPSGTLLTALGDVNGDGVVDEADIAPFVDVMLAPDPTAEQVAVCDFLQVGAVVADDATLLMEKIALGGGCEPYWTHSYSSHMVFLTNQIKVVADDGTEDLYTRASASTWSPPPGVFTTLVADTAPGIGYLLTNKNQWKAHYLANGKLDYVADPTGNRVTCYYVTSGPALGKLDRVVDSSERTLQLTYNSYGKLSHIRDPILRNWVLLYEDLNNPGTFIENGSGYFRVLQDPMTYKIKWDYSSCGEIAAMYDKNGYEDPVNAYGYTFTYVGGRLTQINDPAPFAAQAQRFSYGVNNTSEQWSCYTDRRGSPWLSIFSVSQTNLLRTIDPLVHTQTYGYTDLRPALVHEVADYTNALNKTWHATFDANANVLTTRDPMNHVTTYTYDTLNNLLTATPPADANGNGNPAKRVTYHYADPLHPTSVTSVDDPPAEVGGTTPVTTIAYWGLMDDTPFGVGAWNGLIRSVTPPCDAIQNHPVVTEYEYDAHGHQTQESEGPSSGRNTPLPVITTTDNDGVGQPTGSGNGLSCAVIVYDGNGNVIDQTCCAVFAPPPGNGSSWLPFGTCAAPDVPRLWGEMSGTYTRMGEVSTVANSIHDDTAGWGESSSRDQALSHDHLGRTTHHGLSTTEPGWNLSPQQALSRAFDYSEDWTTGTTERTGPDGQVTYTSSDTAGRVTSFARGAISASVTYLNDDAVDTITYDNGTEVSYSYDDAGWTWRILHRLTDGTLLHQLEYVLAADGVVNSITETDNQGNVSVTTFTHDNRGRLTGETRTEQHPYAMTYLYDIAGNRTQKHDIASGTFTDYTYDVSSPDTYGSQGNRLMYSRTTRESDGVVLEERWYTYDLIGNPELVVRRLDGDVDGQGNQWYRGTRLWYTKDGHVWLSRAERWQLDGGGAAINCEPYAAMEYRYAGGRARYMVRPRDPGTMMPSSAYDGQWFDYDDEEIYSDLSLSYDGAALAASQTKAHVAGMAEWVPGAGAGVVHYLHGNLVGTTERMTDDPAYGGGGSVAQIVHRAGYTAFGEPIWSDGAVGTRYGYVGAYGYQQGGLSELADPLAELGWLHVGERYYDPACGRFGQRDPLGIAGGENVYAYAANSPLLDIDPSGLYVIVIHWKPMGKSIMGHTVVLCTSTWTWMSLVPSGTHSWWQDFWNYGWPDNIWIFRNGSINEIKVTRYWNKKWKHEKWSLRGKHCIDCSMDLLKKGGAPVPKKPALVGWTPEKAREALDKLRKKLGGWQWP